MPWENVANLVYAVQRQVAVQTLGEIQGEYAAMKWTVDPEKKSGEYYDLLYKALERGDLDSYFAIREELPELLGKDHSDIDGAMKSRYTDKLDKDPSYSIDKSAYNLLGIRPSTGEEDDGEEKYSADSLDNNAYRQYTVQRAEDYQQSEDALDSNPIFKGMDEETKNKVLQAAFDLAKEQALVDASGGQYVPDDSWISDASEGEKKGIEPWEFALWQIVKNNTEATKGADGKTVKGEDISDKLMDWLGESGLTEDQQEFLWSTKYTKDFGEYRDDLAEYRSYGPQMDAAYSEMADSLADNPIFTGMDKETRDKVTEAAMKVAKQTAQAEVIEDFEYDAKWIEQTSEAEARGIAPEDYVLWHVVAENTSSDRNADGKEISGQRKQDKLRRWLKSLDTLTEQQKYWLWRQKYATAEW